MEGGQQQLQVRTNPGESSTTAGLTGRVLVFWFRCDVEKVTQLADVVSVLHADWSSVVVPVYD